MRQMLKVKALNKQLEIKFIEADHERVAIIDRYKSLKEENVHIMNEYNKEEQQMRHERMRAELNEAVKNVSINSAT